MSVSYAGKKIIPAPLLTINKQYNRNTDGSKIGTTYSISVKGTFLPYRGSPSGNYIDIDNAFWDLAGYPPDQSIGITEAEAFNSLLKKQSALRNLFAIDGASFEWQPSGGQPVVKCNPRVLSIEFGEGTWAQRCEYNIQLETNWIFINGTSDIEDIISQDLISSFDETWDFEEVEGKEGKQYNVTHTINAQGILGYEGNAQLIDNKQAWEHARDYVVAKVSGSIDSSVMLAALGSINKVSSDYIKSTNVNKSGGSYQITERWLVCDNNTYTNNQYNVDFDDANGEYNVTYQGAIKGLGINTKTGDITSMEIARSAIPSDSLAGTRTTNAVGVLLAGKSLPVSPQNKSFVLNQQDGTVSFTFKWTTSESLVATIIEEVQYNFSEDSLLHVVNYSESIKGVGSTPAEKVANAKASIYTDTVARSRAISLLSGQIPTGTIISTVKLSKLLSINKNTGEIKAGWSWDSRDIHHTEVNIQIQNANDVIATLQVPGRAAGPIVQDMQTRTSKITTVTIRSRNWSSQPSLDTTIYASGFIIGNNETWNPLTTNAERTTRFLQDS